MIISILVVGIIGLLIGILLSLASIKFEVKVDENEEKEILSHMPHCISARWHPTFCDISPIGGTKQLGIDKFLEYYGLDLKDTMAFGDGGNDMQMLKHVNTAIAMGNAGDELKSIADFVTKDVDDEGIAYALKYYGLIDL